MKWLLTVSVKTDIARLADVLAQAGGALEPEEPVRLGEEDLVLYATGPRDLPARLESVDAEIKRVNPSSDFDLFALGPS